MKNIHLPDQNVFEEQSKAFFESKLAKRLQKKYQAKPFEEEYQLLYYVAIATSYFANLLSALTASTWLFSYVFSIVFELPYPFLMACGFTGFTLLGLEALQRFLAGKFFKTRLQYNEESTYTSSLRGLLFGTVTIASISILLSFMGGFDLVQTVTSPPVYQEPVLEDIASVRSHYQNLVNEADKTATDYYNRRRYKNRIATEDASKYREYLDKKIAYQDSLLHAVTSVQNRNVAAKAKAEQAFEEVLVTYESKLTSKGTGLGGAAVLFILLFYISMWFIEYYDYKTASQYAMPVSAEAELSPTLPVVDTENSKTDSTENVLTIEDLQEQINTLKQQTPPLPLPSTNGVPKDGELNTPSPESSGKLPIGFYTERQREDQTEDLFKQFPEVFKQTELREAEIAYKDVFTVAHKDFKTGKLRHLNLGNIENMIDIYTERLKEAEQGSSDKVVDNRKQKLDYWNRKKQELLHKITIFEKRIAVNP